MSGLQERAALRQTLAEGVSDLGLSLSEAAIDRLLDFQGLLQKWNKVYNLTAIRDSQQMVTHHLLDSLAAVPGLARARKVLDVGAGGGLPGVVFAIWAADAHAGMHFTLVDVVAKKTAFLTQARAELGLDNLDVRTGRVEELGLPSDFDVITSRAFAELSDFVRWSSHLLAPGGRFLALKGVLPKEEIERLPADWRVTDVRPLKVPGLDAERHLLVIQRASEAQSH